MAIHLRHLLLIFFITILSSATTADAAAAALSVSSPPTPSSPPPSLPPRPVSPSPPIMPPPPPIRRPPRRSPRRPSRRRRQPPLPQPPPPPTAVEEEATPDQLNNIVDALIGAGDFGDWIGVVSSAILPLSATLFVPENDRAAVATTQLPSARDPFTFSYHVIPQRLSFSELLLFKTNTRLPTLLPGKSVVITNNSRLNFSIDGSPITVPDLYATKALIVHGVARIFDYAVYGQDRLGPLSNPPAQQSVVVPPPPAPIAAVVGISESSSNAAPPCLCIEFPVVLVVVCVIMGFKIQRNNFR